MGILNLSSQLKECHGPSISLSTVHSKRIAIDTSILTMQFLTACDDAIDRYDDLSLILATLTYSKHYSTTVLPESIKKWLPPGCQILIYF
jgi:hypothetical protein